MKHVKLKCIATTAAIFTAALLFADNVVAQKVYRWTGSDGTVHFSDTPPPADKSGESIEMQQSPATSNTGDDPYSIMNQSKRMDESRRQIDARNARLRAEEQARSEVEALKKLAAEQADAASNNNTGNTNYYYQGGNSPPGPVATPLPAPGAGPPGPRF